MACARELKRKFRGSSDALALLTQKIASQESEGVIIANLINLWNAFGKPVCVKNA
jgi:hypothetical protein